MPESDIIEPPVTDKTFLKLIQAIQTVSIKSAVVDNTDTESSTKALSAGQGFKLQREVDADRGENSAYDPTATYDVGDFCINDNALYKCNTAISTPEAWDASHWDAVNLKGLDMSVTSLNTTVTDLCFVDITSEVSFRGVFSNYSDSVRVYDFPKQKLLYVSGLLNMDGQASANSLIITFPARYMTENQYQYIPCFTLGKAINFVAVFRSNNLQVDNNAGSSSIGLSTINGWFRYIDVSA